MPKRTLYNFTSVSTERQLLDDLAAEIIEIHGLEVYYIPNAYANVDQLFGEDRLPNLTNATKIVVYVNGGDNTDNVMFSKFGFHDMSTISLSLAIKEWNTIFPGKLRPLEGDLIYIPGTDTFGPSEFLKITFVDKLEIGGYFPLGRHHTFELECEKWRYSSEVMDTTVTVVDNVELNSNDAVQFPGLVNELNKDNTTIETTADSIIDFSEDNPFGVA